MKHDQARKALILQFAKLQIEYHDHLNTPLIAWNLILSTLIINRPCNVINTECKLNIICHSL